MLKSPTGFAIIRALSLGSLTIPFENAEPVNQGSSSGVPAVIGSNPRLVTWLTGALGLLALVGPASAMVFCVNNAVTLHKELLGAAANGEDDEIHLVQGVYGGNFVYTSAEAKGLAVLGGYSEGCVSRSLDPANTILDGQQAGRVLALLAPEVAAEFTIEGLTLLNGKSVAAPDGNGGGLLANAGTEGLVTLRHNQILNNVGADGGGAYVRAGSISLTANSVYDNAARDGDYGGGGLSLVGSADLSHNRIQANTSNRCGGGILILASNTVLTENHIEDNSSRRGGGVCAYNHFSTTTLDHNLINHNRAREGGGVAFYGPERGAALLVANQFLGNSAVSRGGGVLLWGSHHDATVIDNRFFENSAPEGGGLYGMLSDAVTTLANNSLADNESPSDGGLSLHLAGAAIATSAQLDHQPLAPHPPLAAEGSHLSGGSGDATFSAPEAEIISQPPAPPAPEAEVISQPPAPPEPLLVFSDDFEKADFTGRWVQDGQHDWFVSPQRARVGSRSAEIDGPATDAQLTSIAISPQEATTATITFDWFIESGLDSGEYLAFDVSIDGGSTWTEMARLSGGGNPTPAEDRWHAVRIGLTGLASKDQLRLRFRGSLSAGDEDANLDNLSVTVQ